MLRGLMAAEVKVNAGSEQIYDDFISAAFAASNARTLH